MIGTGVPDTFSVMLVPADGGRPLGPGLKHICDVLVYQALTLQQL